MNWLQNYIKTLDVKEYLHYMDEIIYKQKYPESISLCKTPKEHWVKFGIKENKLFYFSKKFNTSDLYKNILKNHKHTLIVYVFQAGILGKITKKHHKSLKFSIF